VQHRSGSIELGRYRLVERIGEGGSGQVYRAEGPAGPVAVKLLAAAADMDAAARARFAREIAALEQLAHPNLVGLVDHGIDPELGSYLVLPLLAGSNLRELCAGRAICPEAALLVVQPIAHALVALHAAGFVHRDLKPENAIAAPDGTITVIDLGLAWRDGMSRHTGTGTAVGSVGYMAPEQIEGRAVDGKADVWAIGVILYELIAGRRPFARPRPAEEAAAALLGAHPRLSAADRRASEPLADLVSRCLAIDPAARPSAAELAAALDAQLDWTDDVAGDRAAAVADPAAYQARVAPFRIRRVERLAREALASRAPFAALAHCDRGLAYTPDHPALLALVGEAEAATARPTAPAVRPAARPAPRRSIVLGMIAVSVVIAVGVTAGVELGHRDATVARDPWAGSGAPPATAQNPPAVEVKLVPDSADLKLMKDFVSVFGRVASHPAHSSGPMTDDDRKLVGDVIGLFGEAIERASANQQAQGSNQSR